MNKRAGIILGVFAVVTALIIGFGISYYYVEKVNGNNNVNGNIIEKKLNVDGTLVTMLSDIFFKKFNNSAIMSKYDNYFYKRDSVLLSDAPIDLKLNIAAYYIDEIGEDYDSKVFYIKEDDIKEAYEYIFGKGTYHRASFYIANCPAEFIYNSTTDRYEAELGGAGGYLDNINYQQKITGAKQIIKGEKENIEIIETIAFGFRDNEHNCGYEWWCYFDAYENGNLIDKVGATDIDVDVLERNMDKYAQYKYTFEKNEYDQYVFAKVEKVR